MPDGAPLPTVLSGDVEERLIRLDKSLFYLVGGALEWITDYQRYEETGSLTVEQARDALSEMLWVFYTETPMTIPAGTMTQYGGATIPTGWLECDGAVVLQADYPDLYTAIGAAWNTGGEVGNAFRLPDLRGRVGLGAGQGSGLTNRVLGASGGAETHTLSVSEMPVHSHFAIVSNQTVRSETLQQFAVASVGATDNQWTPVDLLSDTGDGAAHNNMPSFAVVRWMIATGG